MGLEEGFNALNDTYENLVHAGVIDLTDVRYSGFAGLTSFELAERS